MTHPVTMERTIRQLQWASSFIIGSGLFILLAAWERTAEPLRLFGELLLWWPDGGTNISPEAQLLSAILGGVMIGWGIVFWKLSSLLPINQVAIKSTYLTSLTLWFITDSIGSIAAGSFLNVAFNLVYLLMFLLPLRRVPHAEQPKIS